MGISSLAADKYRFSRIIFLMGLFLGFAASAMLTGCSGQSSDLDVYLKRLSDNLDTPLPPPQPSSALVMPRPPKPPVMASSASIGMLDLWAIRQCRLHQVIADHNSALGKVAVSSERLMYMLDFLRWAPPCAKLLSEDGNPELAATLMRAYEDYRQRLPEQIWQSTLGGPEFRQFWRRSGVSIDESVAQQSTDSMAALRALHQLVESWLAENYDSQHERFNRALSTIGRGDGGALLLALESIQTELQRADELLEKRLQRRPLCLSANPTPKAKRLMGIVSRYFAQGVQQRAAAYNQRVYKLLPVIQTLEQSLAGAEPETWREWRERRDQRFERARNAPARHVKALLPLLKQCGLQPGA